MSETLGLQAKLRGLLSGNHSSLTLAFNDQQAPNYLTAAEYDEHYGEDGWTGDWVSDEEKQKALATNSVWSLHWYPDTPVGFYCLLASDLDVLLRVVEECRAAGEFGNSP